MWGKFHPLFMPKKPENARKLANRHEKVNVKREPSREFLICVFAFAEAKKSGCHTGRYQKKRVNLSKITLLLRKISLIGEIESRFLRMSSDFFRSKMTFFSERTCRESWFGFRELPRIFESSASHRESWGEAPRRGTNRGMLGSSMCHFEYFGH